MKDETKEVGELLVKGIKKGIEETSKEFQEDEIKEILYVLKHIVIGRASRLTCREADKLLDYITNLQEENKRLKELCDKYEEEHNTTFKLWTMKMEEIPTYEEKKELQNRIDIAIEYIKSNLDNTNWLELGSQDVEVLLNILQGKSDE